MELNNLDKLYQAEKLINGLIDTMAKNRSKERENEKSYTMVRSGIILLCIKRFWKMAWRNRW